MTTRLVSDLRHYAKYSAEDRLLTKAADELERKDAALLDIARRAETLKRACGDDPESAQAIRNGQYMQISYIAREAVEELT